jgi:hypothetical protein
MHHTTYCLSNRGARGARAVVGPFVSSDIQFLDLLNLLNNQSRRLANFNASELFASSTFTGGQWLESTLRSHLWQVSRAQRVDSRQAPTARIARPGPRLST